MNIRPERPDDASAIAALVTRAFRGAPHSSGTEAGIVAGLREARALALSLVAVRAHAIVGHAAFSPVTIDGVAAGWFGLGPLAVDPEWQGRGVGAALVAAGLDGLRSMAAAGCVVLGDPAYYGRFGFRTDQALVLPGVPAAYFQALPMSAAPAAGEVAYHPAFGV